MSTKPLSQHEIRIRAVQSLYQLEMTPDETVEDAILLRAVAEVVVVPNESREASFASLRSQELTVVGHVFMHFL